MEDDNVRILVYLRNVLFEVTIYSPTCDFLESLIKVVCCFAEFVDGAVKSDSTV